MGRTNEVRSDYFDSWNSRMAYVLGYLYADGSIDQDYNTLRLHCSLEDEDVLQLI